MLQKFVNALTGTLGRYAGNLSAAGEILNAQYGDALKVYGVARVVVVSPDVVALPMQGTCRNPEKETGRYLSLAEDAIDLNVAALADGKAGDAVEDLKRAFGLFTLAGDGAYVWIVPDGFMANLSAQEKKWDAEGGGYFSHESMCVQNTGRDATRCELFVFWEAEGREVLRHNFQVPAQRSIHLRLDKIPGVGDQPFIAKDHPVGYKIVSYDGPVVVQGSRILTSGEDSAFASFGTAIAWSPA